MQEQRAVLHHGPRLRRLQRQRRGQHRALERRRRLQLRGIHRPVRRIRPGVPGPEDRRVRSAPAHRGAPAPTDEDAPGPGAQAALRAGQAAGALQRLPALRALPQRDAALRTCRRDGLVRHPHDHHRRHLVTAEDAVDLVVRLGHPGGLWGVELGQLQRRLFAQACGAWPSVVAAQHCGVRGLHVSICRWQIVI